MFKYFKKGKFILISIPFLLIMLVGYYNYYKKPKQNQICFKNNCFEVELAQTTEQQARGLMFRKYLEPNKGMLFIFQNEAKHSFWMKNTLIPLDIIWLNSNKKVVFINKNTLPCQIEECPAITPTDNAKYVLELNGGVANKIGLSVGDEIRIDLK